MSKNADIHEFIVENFLFGDGKDFTPDTNLFDKGIVDSTGVLEILSYIEETFNIVIDDDDVTQSNFSSVNNISNYLQNRLSERSAV
jgi:acyl carrier protein